MVLQNSLKVPLLHQRTLHRSVYRDKRATTHGHNKALMQPEVPSAGKPASVTGRLLHTCVLCGLNRALQRTLKHNQSTGQMSTRPFPRWPLSRQDTPSSCD
mgnify:CR=1 FL=1|jgi:hypothetical protein